jgi:hypothetical protein
VRLEVADERADLVERSSAPVRGSSIAACLRSTMEK